MLNLTCIPMGETVEGHADDIKVDAGYHEVTQQNLHPFLSAIYILEERKEKGRQRESSVMIFVNVTCIHTYIHTKISACG